MDLQSECGAVEAPSADAEQLPVVDVGILTRGKPTLGITLTSLLLQDCANIRISIVDTSDTPVINRDDVTLAMRLAFDREISCSYERLREKYRGFSLGRLRLLEMMKGPHVCLVDDDMALSSSVIRQMLTTADLNPGYGCVSPACKNATLPLGIRDEHTRYTPGSLFLQDSRIRGLLTKYYQTTVDVLDAVHTIDKVWEVAFISELFRQLGRPCICEPQLLIYHLDYHELQSWHLSDRAIVRRSVALAQQFVSALTGRPVAV